MSSGVRNLIWVDLFFGLVLLQKGKSVPSFQNVRSLQDFYRQKSTINLITKNPCLYWSSTFELVNVHLLRVKEEALSKGKSKRQAKVQKAEEAEGMCSPPCTVRPQQTAVLR